MLKVVHVTHGRPCRILSSKEVMAGPPKNKSSLIFTFHRVRLLDTGEAAFRWSGEMRRRLDYFRFTRKTSI